MRLIKSRKIVHRSFKLRAYFVGLLNPEKYAVETPLFHVIDNHRYQGLKFLFICYIREMTSTPPGRFLKTG